MNKVQRTVRSSLNQQFKLLLPTLLIGYLPFFGILLLIKLQTTIPVSYLTRDPLAIVNKPFYLGIISQLGALIWCGCAAICFFSAKILTQVNYQRLVPYLFSSGVLTTILLLDDILLIHDSVFPHYLLLSEKIVYLFYLVMMIFYFFKFRKSIQKTEFLPLILAIMFFGLSILLDQILTGFLPHINLTEEDEYFLEDGIKLLGIVSWFMYYFRVCLTQIKQGFLHQQNSIQTKQYL